MSDDGQEARTRELNAELQRTRRRMLSALAGDWTALAAELEQTYRRMELIILDRIKNLSPDDDPALLLIRLGEVQDDFAVLGRALAGHDDVLAQGARAGLDAGASNLRAGGVRVAWGEVAREQMVAGLNLVDDGAWQAMVGRYAPYHAERVRDIVLDAITRGKNPRETAELLAGYFEGGAPLTDALRIARTSQLYAARLGTQAIYADNGVGAWMWSANLGNPRTCLACIAMHGTVHPVTETLNDHWLGRCAPVPITPKWRDLGIEGEEREELTGVNWFERQPAVVQAQAMGAELYQFWQLGAFEFNPQRVVGVVGHPVFGEMRVRKSNIEILGVDTEAGKRELMKVLRRSVIF